MMSFIHSGSEIRIYRVSNGSKSDRVSQDDIANFQFQRLGYYWQSQNQSSQISMDSLCRLTAKLQNQTQKIQGNIFKIRAAFLKLLRSKE